MAIRDDLRAELDPLQDDRLHDLLGPLVAWELLQEALASFPANKHSLYKI